MGGFLAHVYHQMVGVLTRFFFLLLLLRQIRSTEVVRNQVSASSLQPGHLGVVMRTLAETRNTEPFTGDLMHFEKSLTSFIHDRHHYGGCFNFLVDFLNQLLYSGKFTTNLPLVDPEHLIQGETKCLTEG